MLSGMIIALYFSQQSHGSQYSEQHYGEDREKFVVKKRGDLDDEDQPG
jgi:hypothetical protein